jgi:phage tail-like protein
MPTATKPTSALLNYLPAIYQNPAWTGGDSAEPPFLNDFLLAFEKILAGRDDGVEPEGGSAEYLGAAPQRFQGLDEKVANLHFLFDAMRTPECFLEWLAGWSALTLRTELSEGSRRALIANIIPLYRIRGTKKYLERLLALFLGGGATVDDQSWPGIQIGRYSTVAADTWLGGNQPHHFRVRLSVPPEEESRTEARRRLAHEAIEQAKPAHTYYDLEIIAPRFQVGVHSRVGLDTFLA